VPIGIGIAGISVLHIVQHDANHFGIAEAFDGASEELAPGLPGSYDKHNSISQTGEDEAIGYRYDRWTVEHNKLVLLAQANQKFPSLWRGQQTDRIQR
jgi:hypothetical protein